MGGLQNTFSIEAEGRWDAYENTLSLKKVPAADGSNTSFGFNDWFILHDKDHMTAHASLTKLGLEVATLSAFYERQG